MVNSWIRGEDDVPGVASPGTIMENRRRDGEGGVGGGIGKIVIEERKTKGDDAGV